MGNCFVSNNNTSSMEHPREPQLQGLRTCGGQGSLRCHRIKVRMTAKEYKEIAARAGPRNRKEEIGHLIIEGCSTGKWHAQFTDGYREGHSLLLPIAEETF